jgi:hypothetical protein
MNKIEENIESSFSQNKILDINDKDFIYGKDNNNTNENKIIVSVKNEEKDKEIEKSNTGSNKTLVKNFIKILRIYYNNNILKYLLKYKG